ncbi:MAG: hypothetical protein KF845_16335 [Cyclobacteriaceae bacterium]|nr:hypothetical protein [Cyclobacteriaceae bacterium]
MIVKKLINYGLLPLAGIYLVLLIPDSNSSHVKIAEANAFVWNMDERWKNLETEFTRLKKLNKPSLDSLYQSHHTTLQAQLNLLLEDSVVHYNDARLLQMLDSFFEATPLAAATQHATEYLALYNTARKLVKRQSQHWDLNSSEQRNSIYALLYGMRAAIEEVLLQADTVNFNAVQYVTDESSETPSAMLQGIRVHSGDLLLSRGGAEVSAFISRGNDYPGNFSHVALLYISETGQPEFIEAHIEKGVAIASADEYMKDKKLRFMVLRPRAGLSQLKANPMLPHLAALYAKQESEKRHIPYDFKMNFYDSTTMFCSEVGSYAYKKHGIQLWQAESTISSAGTARWLGAFGVENFVTQMPSDLEYDPQLSIVAEWCDPETLLKDHIDNAVMDALLEQANVGKEIEYSVWLLPIARVVKGYSMLQNAFDKPGIIPEGMSATQALKNNSFVEMYQAVRSGTEEKVTTFTQKNGYRPPYWQLVEFAVEATNQPH